MAEFLDEVMDDEKENDLGTKVNQISMKGKRLSLGRALYHLATFPPLAYLSYVVTGISGVFFTSFLTLGGIVKRKKIGEKFSGEKVYRDLKAGTIFSHLVYGLYKFVNLFTNPIAKTAALNPFSFAIFNGAYLAYTYLRDKIIEDVGGAKVAYDTFKGKAPHYLKRVWNEELKPNWMKLNLKTLIFLPVNFLNVNYVKQLYQQIFIGSLVDFAYGVFTAGRKR